MLNKALVIPLLILMALSLMESTTYTVYLGVTKIYIGDLGRVMKFYTKVYILRGGGDITIETTVTPQVKDLEDIISECLKEFVSGDEMPKVISFSKNLTVTYGGRRFHAVMEVRLELSGSSTYFIPSRGTLAVLLAIAFLVGILAIRTILLSEKYRVT